MSRRKYIPSEAAVRALPDTGDREMQKVWGASASVWARVRREHGIPRFRNRTIIDGAPAPWVAKPEPKPRIEQAFYRAPVPTRDYSVAGEAAAFLQRERFTCFSRDKLGMGEGWQVGRSVLDTASMIAKAARLGFQQQAWMGG